jgi:hypothetical protein
MKESNKKFYMKKLLINENERNEILEKHLSFKKVLEEKLEQTKKGLTLEQVDDVEEANRNILDSALSKKCLSGGEIKTIDGKSVYVKTATKDTPDIIKVGDEIYQYGIHNNLYFTFWVKPKGGNTLTGPYKWKCPQVNTTAEVNKTNDEESKVETLNDKREKTRTSFNTSLTERTPTPKGCAKAIDDFYESWENKVNDISNFNDMKEYVQTCTNFFNGKWKNQPLRGPLRKKIELLSGGIGGTSISSKWRLVGKNE